jgi:DNA-binding FrmR family transcriptional regulator
MVEEDRYCPEIITQIASVQEALRGVGRQLLRNHLGTRRRRRSRKVRPTPTGLRRITRTSSSNTCGELTKNK